MARAEPVHSLAVPLVKAIPVAMGEAETEKGRVDSATVDEGAREEVDMAADEAESASDEGRAAETAEEASEVVGGGVEAAAEEMAEVAALEVVKAGAS